MQSLSTIYESRRWRLNVQIREKMNCRLRSIIGTQKYFFGLVKCSRLFFLNQSTTQFTLSGSYSTTAREISEIIQYIRENTEISREHLTPEIQLHLITPKCKLWTAKEDEVIYPDPYWAFYWPGGQVLTRYILDHPTIVRDKNVLDVGSGCGASAIAAALCGAKDVLANDICEVATEAIKLNADLNRVVIRTDQRNLIGNKSSADQWDVVLLGDMFYDEAFTKLVSDWLRNMWRPNRLILIGDPGRVSFINQPITDKLKKIATYSLHSRCRSENNGLTHGHVWKFTS